MTNIKVIKKGTINFESCLTCGGTSVSGCKYHEGSSFYGCPDKKIHNGAR
jgi:hypothetical protein